MEWWAMLGFGAGLGVLHAAIPSHWMPLAALARGLHWTTGKLVRTTLAIGLAHIVGTIALGVGVGALGHVALARYEETGQWAASAIVVALGLVFIARDLVGRRHDHAHCCGDPLHAHAAIHLHDARALAATTEPPSDPAARAPEGIERMSIASIFLAMLASPCLLLVPYYLEAARLGWAGIAGLSLVYVAVTLPVMVGLVVLAHAGIGRLRWALLDRHERALCGALLIIAAIAGRALHELSHAHGDHDHAHHAHDHDPVEDAHDAAGSGSGSGSDEHKGDDHAHGSHDHDHAAH